MECGWSSLITLVIITLAIETSSAIQCYLCDSQLKTDSACEDPFNATGVSTTLCSGSCTKLKGMKDSFLRIQRDCYSVKQKEECIDETAFGAKVNFCVCNSDRCNPATTTSVSRATI